jgi:DNA (cytosine-5)-methyltransferase 1
VARKKIFRFIDLFCGAGGLAQGFRQTGDDQVEFRSVFAVEVEPVFAASYAANFGDHVFVGPIEKLKPDDLPKAELVIGGPPCQGFSLLGKVSPTERHPNMNRLWRYFFKVVEWVRPAAFVIENVPEFLRSYEFLDAVQVAHRLGYDVADDVLDASKFGVPQKRRRGFVVGVRRGIARLPKPNDGTPLTVRDAIWDLRDKPLVRDFNNGAANGRPFHRACELHIGRNPRPKSLERYQAIPPGGNRFTLMRNRPDITPACWFRKKEGATDVMGRLEWDRPALTIRTEFFKPEKGRYLHPEQDRPITHWEAARIQTFPDDFIFCGSKIEVARQIGNAVPPKLAEAVARELKTILLEKAARPRRADRLPLRYARQLSLLSPTPGASGFGAVLSTSVGR